MSFNATVFNCKNRLLRPNAIHFFRNFCREEHLSPEARQLLILRRLQSLLTDAYENTVFYHRKYDEAGVHPSDIKSIADFEKLPPVSKDEVREFRDDFIRRGTPEKYLLAATTGGSTGVPLKVFHDKRLPTDTIAWWLLRKWGAEMGDNVGYIYRHRSTQHALSQLLWFPTRRAFLDVCDITPESCDAFYRQCQKNNIIYICGYVGAVNEFANWLDARQLKLPSLRFVWTTSAPLPNSIRCFMEGAFDCPVFSQYGCCEIFWLGAECPNKEGLHYFDTIRHLEVVNDNFSGKLDGEEGEILLTDLLNHLFPLIRYRNGDRGAKSAKCCSCGSGFPLIAPIKGRVTEVFELEDGAVVAGDFLTTIFDQESETVRGFQVVQKPDRSILLRCIPCNEHATERIEFVRKNLEQRLAPHHTAVRVEITDHIAHDRGKQRFVVCECASGLS
ncbi:MAG: hypothetical protein WCS73_05025 [Lentisphaeria bacterium]